MSLEHLYPYAGNHAIQSVTAVVEWADGAGGGMLQPEHLADLVAAAGMRLRELNFPDQKPVQMMQMAFGQGVPAGGGQTITLGGLRASREGNARGTQARSVMLTRENLMLQINDYTRWSEIRLDIEQCLQQLLPLVGVHRAIRHINLQFNDVFRWRANPADLHMNEVFRKENRWLPAHVFDVPSFWHSHHGYLAERTVPIACQQLNNINVSYGQQDNEPTVQALLAHQGAMPVDSPLWVKTTDAVGPLMELLDAFHTDNSSILADIFSDEVLQRIKLKVPGPRGV
jgi:uncharacterized protein (TIGR04255 family)